MSALLVAAYLWLFWGLYVLVMGLYRAYLSRRLGPIARVLGAPFLLVGAAMDVVCNLTLACAVFVELPRELLVTTRLSRHIHDGSGWRRALAQWVCTALLDPFDPSGLHCR